MLLYLLISKGNIQVFHLPLRFLLEWDIAWLMFSELSHNDFLLNIWKPLSISKSHYLPNCIQRLTAMSFSYKSKHINASRNILPVIFICKDKQYLNVKYTYFGLHMRNYFFPLECNNKHLWEKYNNLIETISSHIIFKKLCHIFLFTCIAIDNL